MEIGIVNWDKYNPKRDQKTYTWLRLDNEVCTGQDMSEYDAHELLVWIALLCEASKKNSGSLSLKLGYIARAARTTTEVVSNALNKLMVDGLIQIHDFVHTAIHDRATTESDRARPQEIPATTPTYERTNVTNETNERFPRPISEGEFIGLFNTLLGGQGKVRFYPGFNLTRDALNNFILTTGFPQFRTVEQWEKLLKEEVLRSDFLMGRSDKTFVVSLNWLANQDNAAKVASGLYTDQDAAGSTVSSLDSLDLSEVC